MTCPHDRYQIQGESVIDFDSGTFLVLIPLLPISSLWSQWPGALFNTLLPTPERRFLAFAEPIEVLDCRDRKVSKALEKPVRSETADAVESLLGDMLLL